MDSLDVDAVVMWVDGSDPAWLADYKAAISATDASERPAEGKGRHRDNGELRFCLRSIEMHAPWIRRIHIVTNGQVPSFIDPEHPKISIVPHSSFFPDADALPTFNSFAIDSTVHRIDGLSESFIRFSDDFMLMAPLEPDWFFGESEMGRHFLLARVKEPSELTNSDRPYMRTLAHNRALANKHGATGALNPAHAPQMRHRSVCKQIEEALSDEFAATRRDRFRTEESVIMLYLYPHLLASQVLGAESDANGVTHPDFSSKRYACQQVQMGSEQGDWKKRLLQARERAVQFLNVNDAFGETPRPEALFFYYRYMLETFPEPASFEMDNEFALRT